MDSRYYCMDPFLGHSADAVLTGTLDHTEPKANSSYFYLKDVSVRLIKEGDRHLYFSDFLVIVKNNPEDSFKDKNTPAGLPSASAGRGSPADIPVCGNLLRASGTVCSFASPTNPGQFDEKAFFKEKNIFYQMAASDLSVINERTSVVKQSLYHLKDRIRQVYEDGMPQKEAGVTSAMLLGDKTLLDADMKSLYQVNGIGHILAISGLHITIFCTLCFKILSILPLPRPIPFLVTFFVLAAYAAMTGFGISTSRAVIMMLLALFAKEIGRSYEPLTAAAASAVCILLQKPYALFSCSFLLSYSAVLGVLLTYPVLNAILSGRLSGQAAGGQRVGQGPVMKFLFLLREKLVSSLLASLSIQITSLPVLLYFFYEIPTYGIFLNLLVLPLVSVILALSLSGGILGLFVPALSSPLLYSATQILRFYEALCRLFLKLPEPIQIFGRPSPGQIVIYYLLLAVSLWTAGSKGKWEICRGRLRPLLVLLCMLLSVAILLQRRPVSGLRLTMLDVGQGDGLFLQEENGATVLIDGGSSDVSRAGTYRIMPYLKYYGIRRIDYMIMSHSDEDHISGQRELLENPQSGIEIGCYLMPYLPQESQDESYRKIKETARKAGVPVRFFNTGDSIRIGDAELLCLHPDREFKNDSPNACSVTLSLNYGSFHMLLTGDLEKEGEEAVLKRLRERGNIRYTMLKTAHHGSKNSTGDAFLSSVQPSAALISCGRKNRYGHPHQELLERLKTAGSRIFRTDESGAVRIDTNGKEVFISCYIED